MMDDSWKAKCSSTLQFSGPPVASSSSQELRNQMESNRGYYSYSYGSGDSGPTMLGRLQERLFASMPHSGSHRSEHATLENSLLAFLSGSPPVLQSSFQELSNPKPIGTSSKLMTDGNNLIVNGIGSAIPLTPSGLLSENWSGKNLQRGTYFCPSVSSRTMPSSSFESNSSLHDLQSSDLAKAVNCDLVPRSQKVMGSDSLSGKRRGVSPADTGKACSEIVQTSKKMPVEANSSLCNQASSFMNGCPRVFCSTTRGILLLSNTGLVGIVCSCHCLHMSVFKFCEHSGLYGVNPGDSVRMDTGDTIAQWCKLYFLKSGIKVPEERSEWDWPEALSATGLVKASESTPNISSNLFHMVHTHGAPARSRQSFDSVSQSQTILTNQSYVGSVKDKQKRNIKDNNNILLKGVTRSSQGNLHGMAENLIFERPRSMSKLLGSGLEDGCQSVSAYVESMKNRNSAITYPTKKNGNSSFTHPSLQDGRTIGKESNFYRTANENNGAFRDAAISSFELRLGQPHQLGQTSGNSNMSATGPQLLDTLANPFKSLYPEQMIPDTANCTEDVEQCRYISAGPSNPSGKRDRNQLICGNNAVVFGNAIDTARVEKSNSNLAQVSVISLLTNLSAPPEDNAPQKFNNYIYGGGMQNTLHYEPCSGKYDPANVLLAGSNSVGRKFGMPLLGSYRLIDKANGVGCTTDDSHLSEDLGCIRNEKLISSSFNELGGSSSPHFFTAHKNSYYSGQLSGVPPDGPDSRRNSNLSGKVISFGNSEQVDHVSLLPLASSIGSGVTFPPQAVSKGILVNASTSVPNQASASSREDLVGVSTHSPDDSSQMFALKKTHKLSNQQQALSSFPMARGEGRFGSYMQSFVESSTFGKQSQQLSESGIHGFSYQSADTCRVGSEGGFTSMTRGNTCCHFSSLKQGNTLQPEQVDLQHQIAFVPLCDEQSSVRRSGQNSTEPGEHERCCHNVSYSYFHGSRSCAANINSLERNFEPRNNCLPNACKEKIGTVNREASTLFSNTHNVPKHENFSFNQSRKLHRKVAKNVCHSSQWKDVPSKVKTVSDVTRVDHLTNLFDGGRQGGEQPGDASVKCFTGTVHTLDSSKEHEISNNSSRCSVPAVTNVSNMGSSTVDGDNGYASNLVVDEGSGNHRCWSSDDAFGSEKNAECFASTGNTSFSKVESYKDLNHHTSCNLLDELKLLNSLTWRKGQNQTPAGLDHHEKYKCPQNFDRGLKTAKEKREMASETCTTSDSYLVEEESHRCNEAAQISSSLSKGVKMIFPLGHLKTRTLGACDTQFSSKPTLPMSPSVKKLSRKRDLCTLYDDNNKEVHDVYHAVLNGHTEKCEIAEVSRRKKCKVDFSCQFQIQESSHKDGTKAEYNSIGCLKSSSSQQVNVFYRKTRPVVCGDYGELANGSLAGDIPKPAKLVPLSKVLNASRKCTIPTKLNAKSTPTKKLKKTSRGRAVADPGLFYRRKTDKDNKCHYTVCGKINDTCMEKMKKECKKFQKDMFLLEEGGDDRSEQDHSMRDSIAHVQLKPKAKETRKRSIYELTGKEKDPGFESSTLPKSPICLPPKKEGKLLKTGEDSNLGLRAKNSTLEQQCRSAQIHRWCAHHKGLLQSEVEGDSNENVVVYGRCGLLAAQLTYELGHDPLESEAGQMEEEELTCSRTEGYKGRKRDGLRHYNYVQSNGNGGCLVPQEQLNAWVHINGQKSSTQVLPKLPISHLEHDCRKEYGRYKQAKLWKHLVVYKSGIHALGLYTSRFISRNEMVVEYVGEIVGQRVADKRENEYQSGKRLQYKSACYFFRIDKEHIIDATCKGGIARFVNHSCMPNCIAKVISVRNEKKVVFFAERDIFPGEEITYDYHFNHEDEGKKIPCFCSSKNCRRYLN